MGVTHNPRMSSHYRGPSAGGGMTIQVPPVTPMLRVIMWTLAVSFALQAFSEFLFQFQTPITWLQLSRDGVLEHFAVWQLVTYALLHGDIWHLLMNLLGLWMFGGDVERVLGSRGFLRYLVICVVGGGLAYLATAILTGSNAPVIGVSAGVLGVLVGFAMFFPERELFLFPLPFPIKARTIALIYGAIDLYNAMASNLGHAQVGAPGGRVVAFTAHLGGMLVGLLYLLFFVRGGGLGWRNPFKRQRPFRVIQGRRDDPFDIH